MFTPARDFGLFMSVTPTPADEANLRASGVQLVMGTYGWLTPAWLAAHPGLRVVCRLSDADAHGDPNAIRARISELHSAHPLAAVIAGCEPDAPFGMQWGEAWREDAAWVHADMLQRLMTALAPLGVPLVSPGWRERGTSEGTPPQPGVASWREICTPVYNAAAFNSAHIYLDGWASGIDRARFRFAVARWAGLRHRLLFLDEVGINSGGQLQRMAGYVEMARILASSPELGSRVQAMFPFCSNGDGRGWDPGYILNDPGVYAYLGAYLAGRAA